MYKYMSNIYIHIYTLGILVETMRREGYEMTVSPPKVLAVIGEDGISREPFEEVIVDVDPDLQGILKDIDRRCL
jgi:predicted membrane GTPase involved in stress response